MYKISLSLIAVCFCLILGSCKKSFLDVNQNPNQATESAITPDLTLAAQLNTIAARNASSWDYLNRWLGYWSASGGYSRATQEMSYAIPNTFGEGTWNNIYYTVSQLKSMERKSEELGWKFYQGISKIMQAHEVGVLVDLYGNVPFTNAWDLAGNIRPSYDNGEDIYKALIPMIDEGIALIKAADGSDRNISTQDIVFQGDKTNWAKFANTIKLRLLIHTSNTSTFNVQSEIGKIQAEGSGFLGEGLGAMVQPGYTPDKPNPYYNAHLFLQNGNEADDYNRANNFVLNLMKNMNDERYKRFYRPAAATGEFRGTDYGQDPITENAGNRTAGVGYGPVPNATSPMWIMTSVEAMFLRAEAVIRGWLPGDPQAAYNAAVTESFEFLNVPNAETEATEYLAGINPRVAWPTSGALQDQIAVLAWQKYFALNGIQANETWTDIRRLGVVNPPLSLAPERGSNPIPVRLLYPSGEYFYNSENVNAQGTINQFTSKIFWDN